MIVQKRVLVGDKTAPTVDDIGKKITAALEATKDTAFKCLETWLQMPVDSTIKVALDKNCKGRADDVSARLSADGKVHKTTLLSATVDVKGTWKSIDTSLAADQAVVIEAAASHVCGDASYFVNKEKDIGFHVIVLLAVGADSDGSGFYLGFDPDVSATAESRAKWKELVAEGTKIKELDSTEQSTKILKGMLLGDSTHGFGPLIRKYYIDTTKKFPQITRV